MPRPRYASVTITSQSQAKVARSVTMRAKAIWAGPSYTPNTHDPRTEASTASRVRLSAQ